MSQGGECWSAVMGSTCVAEARGGIIRPKGCCFQGEQIGSSSANLTTSFPRLRVISCSPQSRRRRKRSSRPFPLPFFSGSSIDKAPPPPCFDFNRNAKKSKKKNRTKSEDPERRCCLSSVEDRLPFSERRRKTLAYFF